ncbi:MAG TPA: hypothetical protein VJC18_04205, partial [bacterium]|nr:hypothetical protein [bacterium]
CSGWALSTPASILCILGLIVFIRWVPRVQSQRNIFGLGLEILILLGLIVTTISSYLFILNKAFFSNNPLTYETFCSTRSPLFGLNQVANFCWEVALTQPEQTLKSPYLLTVPTLAIRIVYFVWAIVVGFFLFGELKNLLPGLKHYFGLGTKPLFKRKPKKNDASAT